MQLHSWDFQKEKNELDSSDDETDTHIRVVQKEFEVDWAQVDKIRAMNLTFPTEVGKGGVRFPFLRMKIRWPTS